VRSADESLVWKPASRQMLNWFCNQDLELQLTVFNIRAPLAGLAPTMQILFPLLSLVERSSSVFL
jgi:hypothetical protein